MSWLVTAVVVSTVATGASIYQQNKSAKAQKKANAVNRKIEERQRKREQMDQLRQAQIARAQAVAAGVNTGTQDSSGMQGQVNSISAQTASNVAYSNQVQTGANVVGMYQQQAADAQQIAGNWAALAELSMTVGNIASQKPKTQSTGGSGGSQFATSAQKASGGFR